MGTFLFDKIIFGPVKSRREVMIYTIERDTPFPGLKKVPEVKLREIGMRVNSLGINAQISA